MCFFSRNAFQLAEHASFAHVTFEQHVSSLSKELTCFLSQGVVVIRLVEEILQELGCINPM